MSAKLRFEAKPQSVLPTPDGVSNGRQFASPPETHKKAA
jgi:hypothetical protein